MAAAYLVGGVVTALAISGWQTYRSFNLIRSRKVLRFIDRPGQPFLGSGETGQGPAAASIANAIANVTGRRLRNLPLTRKRIKDAIDA